MSDKAADNEPSAPPARRRRDGFPAIFIAPPILWQVAFFVAPLIVLVWMTFWKVQNFRLVRDFVTDNWTRVFSQSFFYDAYVHTFTLATANALLASLIAFPAAYFLAFRAKPFTRQVAIVLLVTPFFTSYLVRVYSLQIILAEQGIINYVLGGAGLGPITMLGNSFGTILGYLTLTLPLVTLVQLLALSNVDTRLMEAAENLGCPPLTVVWKVVLPSARVGLIMAGTFGFLLSFGDYVSPLFLGGSKPPTLSILIADQVKSGNHWPRASVVAVVMVGTLVTVLLLMTLLAYARKGKR
ncbi:ABC transporter permease [Acuticoccus kandeliae]|uniref:ABC transporter permease n=1 Tax=Acuticoccus kandeliae TaxID=2073160 RepID=UPI000D3EA591|nr:ABC transporter permease [Acuticoccus kandeliae]